MWLLGQIAICAALWGAIRADIRAMHRELREQSKRMDRQETRALDGYSRLDTRITAAHQRIDAATGNSRRKPI
jgi:hypothetical protein